MRDNLQQFKDLQQRVKELEHSGNYGKLLPLMLELVAAAAIVYGKCSVRYAAILNDLGGVERDMGKYHDAERSFVQAADILMQVVGVNNVNYATVLNNMAGLYRLSGKVEQSEQLFLQTLAIYHNTIGQEHFLTISAMNNLGLLYQQIGRYDEAYELHENCRILLKAQGKNAIAYATTLNNLTGIYKKRGRPRRAMACLRQALGIYRRQVGCAHPLYACALNNLASELFNAGKLQAANRYFEAAMTINAQMFGEDSLIYQTSFSNLEMTRLRL